MLDIENLHVSVDGKEIIKGLTLSLQKGKTHVLMGPNGSGKSSLAHVLMGHPKYQVTAGSITYNGEDLLVLKPHERAQKGVFLSFQYPREVTGVPLLSFLRAAYNSIHEEKLSILEAKKRVEHFMRQLSMDESFLHRSLNEGFSGGEKKKSEVLQLLTLDPSFALLDETDSGLDIDALKIVAQGIATFKREDRTVLLITHYRRLLDYVIPDHVLIMRDGKIVKEGATSLVDELEKSGYAFLEQ